MRFPKIKIPPFLATAAKRVQERLRRVWRRIAIRKADVQSGASAPQFESLAFPEASERPLRYGVGLHGPQD